MSSIRDFVPLAKLGQGTFSTVYKVRRLSDQKIYALKKVRMNNLSQKQKENALNEIRILASFQCENIVAYKQAFFDDKLQVLCIVMQYADGGDLHRLITQTKKDYRNIPQVTIWKVAADIINALEHLHIKGILHRDLKSANIFILGDVYKLGDLNVSKVNGGKLAYTQTGTPYYASPQVWRDEPYDNKSDIWSFGCILYELASLKPPFQGKDMDELFKNIQKNAFAPIPHQYSIQLAELIQQCLQKNPKNRPKASQLLEHQVISRFKNRKNNPIDESLNNKQLLRTIKLPSDLRSLKMNLPSSKYNNDRKSQQIQQSIKLSRDKYDARYFISERPDYQEQRNSNIITSKLQILKNSSYMDNREIQPKGLDIYLSPRSVKKIYQNQSLVRSPEQMIGRKLASAHVNNSEKRLVNNTSQYADRINSAQQLKNQNYSDRRTNSQKKPTIIDKYDKFIQQQLQKKPMAIPRTEKRIASSQEKLLNLDKNPSLHIPEHIVGPQKKDIQQWRKKLVKKSRVFSNNIFANRPIYHNNN